MPFVDSAGRELTSIELGQVPVTAPTFQLRERIGYVEAGTSPEKITWAEAHIPDIGPSPGNRTDLASVPLVFWSLIASYGRQTAAAVVHDVGHTGVTNAFHSSTSSPLGARPRTAVPDDALPSAAIQRRQSARERSVRVSDFQMAAAHSSDLFRLLPAPQWVGGSSSRRAWPHSGTTPPERWRASSSCPPSGPPTVRAHPDLWDGKP